jgi:hypothetical protein
MKNLPNPEIIENNFRLQQYRNLENWDKVFYALAKRYKALQIFLQNMAELLWFIDKAEGVQLDNIGEILGISRQNNISDYLYRIHLRDNISKNYSGTFPELVQFLIRYTTDSDPEIIQEHPFGSLICFTPNGTEADSFRFNSVSAAGILSLVGNYFQMIDNRNEALQFFDGSIWLLTKENVDRGETIFRVVFILIGGTPLSFSITVNNYNGKENQTDFALYNFYTRIAWSFKSNDLYYQNIEGAFNIIDGVFEYEIKINLLLPGMQGILSEYGELIFSEDRKFLLVEAA